MVVNDNGNSTYFSNMSYAHQLTIKYVLLLMAIKFKANLNRNSGDYVSYFVWREKEFAIHIVQLHTVNFAAG